MTNNLTNDLTADEVRHISEDSDMVAVKLLGDRGVTGYVPRRKHIARQLLATMESNAQLYDANDVLMDALSRATGENSRLKTSLEWIDGYISRYCIIMQPKETAAMKSPEEAIRDQIRKALRNEVRVKP